MCLRCQKACVNVKKRGVQSNHDLIEDTNLYQMSRYLNLASICMCHFSYETWNEKNGTYSILQLIGCSLHRRTDRCISVFGLRRLSRTVMKKVIAWLLAATTISSRVPSRASAQVLIKSSARNNKMTFLYKLSMLQYNTLLYAKCESKSNFILHGVFCLSTEKKNFIWKACPLGLP